MLGILHKFTLVLAVFGSSLFSYEVLAHRDSDSDIMIECLWNQRYLESTNLSTSCNDLYHLYQPTKLPKMSKVESTKMGSFNMYILAGQNRNKELPLISKIFNTYDIMAVSEVQHSTTEELKSNINLNKNTKLEFKKYYHPPGYLKLLEELRKTNPSWSLIISPAAQSESEELVGFYFKADRIQLETSEYCEEYNRDLRTKRSLFFAGGIMNKAHGRKPVSPHLNKSYGCILGIDEDENSISRIPFSSRFKMASGFDFQYLSYHARYDAPISIGRSCGFECLELVSKFYNLFHNKGSYLKTLDYSALRLLNGHLSYLSLKASSSDRGLFDGFSALTKLKYGRPRIYDNVIKIRELFKKEIPNVLETVWKRKYSKDISKTNRDRVKKYLNSIYSSPDEHLAFKAYVKKQGKLYKSFIKDIFNEEPFASIGYRISIWQQPADVARFYAISLITDEMESISSKERDTDVILGGDLNLEVTKRNSFYWEFLKNKFDYADIFVEEATSIGNVGIANSYDHFLFDKENSFEECEGENFFITDFVNKKSWWKGFEEYFVKSKTAAERVSKKAYDKFSKLNFIGSKGEVTRADKLNVTAGYNDCWDGKTYKNQPLAKVWQKKLECQTLKYYVDNTEPFRIYKDIISDHMPVGLTCNKLKDLD